MRYRIHARLLTVALILLLVVLAGACRPTPTPLPPTATPVPPTDTPAPEAPTEEPTEEPTPAYSGTVAEIVASIPDLSSLAAAIEEADLAEKLSGEGPYTIFAPTNAAFEAVDADLLADPDLIFDIVLYHIVEDSLTAEDAAAQGTAISLLGDELTFTAEDGGTSVNDIAIEQADIVADNGTVHITESVLLPPTLGTE